MYQNIPTKVLTDEVRLSYCHLSQPYASENIPGAEPKYSVVLLIPKTNTRMIEDIKESIHAAAKAATTSAWGGYTLPENGLMAALHDGDGVNNTGKPYGPEAKGCWVLNASTKTKPMVVHISNIRAELAPQDIYSGMYGRVTINFYGTNKGGNKLCCGLGNVLKTRDGEPLSGGASAEADFAGLEDPNAPISIPQVAAYTQPAVNPITGLPM